MSESPVDKTSRKFASIIEKYCFRWQATVYLADVDIEDNLKQIAQIKRLIENDNSNQYILYFISHSTNKETGEQQPFICFYSWENLIGVRVRAEQNNYGFRVVGESSSKPNRKLISRRLRIDMIEGLVKAIKRDKIFDLNMYFGDHKFRRYSFLNKKCKPTDQELAQIREEYLEERNKLYAKRSKSSKS